MIIRINCESIGLQIWINPFFYLRFWTHLTLDTFYAKKGLDIFIQKDTFNVIIGY